MTAFLESQAATCDGSTPNLYHFVVSDELGVPFKGGGAVIGAGAVAYTEDSCCSVDRAASGALSVRLR